MAGRILRLLPVLGLAAAAVLVVVLSQKTRDLEERYQRVYERAVYPYAGMYVPTFQASTLTGEPVKVGEAEGRQVLFVFTTTCPYCRSTLPYWRQVTAALDTSSVPVEVYGVTLDSAEVTRRYVEENRLPFPVLEFPEEKLAALYRARTVPLTLVLDEEGRVIHSRLGEIRTQAAVDSVLAAVRWRPAGS